MAAVSTRLHEIAGSGTLADLHWPNFTDYRLHFEHVYEAANFAPVWISNGKPTPQALAVIQALEASKQKGLNPDDYDASRWTGRLHGLDGSPTADTVARFDAALTVGVMRYISDLHIGRVNPKHFNFGIDIEQKKYDLPQFVTTRVIHAADVQSVLDSVEPPYNGYKATETMLQKYLQLAAQGDGPQIPDVAKTVAPGDAYAGINPLVTRLRLLGNLHADTVVDANSPTYSGRVVDGVKTFQSRHGLAVTGKIDKQTISQLNTPLAFRVSQLQDALERWRWLPPQFPQPPIVANIPEFILRAYGPNQKVAFASNVVVGKALRTQTPVFANTMKYIVFRPYWNVPTGIVRGEIIPAITRDRNYISKKNFEVTDFNGKVITDGPISDEVLAQLLSRPRAPGVDKPVDDTIPASADAVAQTPDDLPRVPALQMLPHRVADIGEQFVAGPGISGPYCPVFRDRQPAVNGQLGQERAGQADLDEGAAPDGNVPLVVQRGEQQHLCANQHNCTLIPAAAASQPPWARRAAHFEHGQDRTFCPYLLQAAITSRHLHEPRDWRPIAALYQTLAQQTRSPDRRDEPGHRRAPDGPVSQPGLAILDRLDLDHYRYLHSTRAELRRRADRDDQAHHACRRRARPRADQARI